MHNSAQQLQQFLMNHHQHVHMIEELIAISTVLVLFLMALVAFACSLHHTQAMDGCRQMAQCSCCSVKWCCCCCSCLYGCRRKEHVEPLVYDSLQELLVEAERGQVARIRSSPNNNQYHVDDDDHADNDDDDAECPTMTVESFFIDILHQDEKAIISKQRQQQKRKKKNDARYRREPGDGRLQETLL